MSSGSVAPVLQGSWPQRLRIASGLALFVFALAGSDFVLEGFRGWAPGVVVDIVAGFGFLTHFQAIARGVIDLRDAIFFGSVIVLALFLFD